jgi:excisionase family DNA binding protein
MKESSPDPHTPLAVKVSKACELTSIGRTAMYALIQEGRVKTVKIGNRRLVLFSSLEALLAE